jgi:hypothetical protein
MGAPLAAMLGAGILARSATWFATSRGGQYASSVFHNPFVQSGQFGLGYTSSAYVGYGATNTLDPFGLHKKHYKQGKRVKFRMPYGRYGRSYGRYRRYRGYRRRSYYRRRYY